MYLLESRMPLRVAWNVPTQGRTAYTMSPVTKRNTLWIALFIVLASTLAIPFLFVHEPPLLDYTNHLARTFILNHLHDPAFNFADYYEADWKPYPYVLWDV